MEWKEFFNEAELGETEDERSIQQSVLMHYVTKFNCAMPKPDSAVNLIRLACKIHLLKLDRVVYTLSGAQLDQINRSIDFCFGK